VSRLGHLLAFAGLLAVGAALVLDASAWPGAAVATVGALLVAIDGLAQWATTEENSRHWTATAERLDALEKQLAQLAARLETAERRDALGRM
jgi:ABC-type protease/lipase transport system fused ATPase/permease subunit